MAGKLLQNTFGPAKALFCLFYLWIQEFLLCTVLRFSSRNIWRQQIMLVLMILLLFGISTTHASPQPFSRDLPFVINFFQRFHKHKWIFLVIANVMSISGLQNPRHHQVNQCWTRWTFIVKVGWSGVCGSVNFLQVRPSATRFPLDQLRREARAQAKV